MRLSTRLKPISDKICFLLGISAQCKSRRFTFNQLSENTLNDQASKALLPEVLNIVKKTFKPSQGSCGAPVWMYSIAVEASLQLQEALSNTLR
jgi:hypothetical protein